MDTKLRFQPVDLAQEKDYPEPLETLPPGLRRKEIAQMALRKYARMKRQAVYIGQEFANGLNE
jgi:hypothetical protein